MRERGLAAGAFALAALFAAGPARSEGGDARTGEEVYSRCLACHALAFDRTGPRHCGLFGRHAGSVPGFAYSDEMKRSKIVWNAATLDRFIADPVKVMPGTAMGYAGVKDARERADLIAYLKAASSSKECVALAPPAPNRASASRSSPPPAPRTP